jgi:hypothetical protein
LNYEIIIIFARGLVVLGEAGKVMKWRVADSHQLFKKCRLIRIFKIFNFLLKNNFFIYFGSF